MDAAVHNAYRAALEWYIDQGVDEALVSGALDRFAAKDAPVLFELPPRTPEQAQKNAVLSTVQALGTSEAYGQAVRLAKEATTLEALRIAIEKFDGIALKKTASNLVFSDGNPKAQIMIISDAPGGDEDRAGRPFCGESGQLLDKILSCVHLDRNEEDPAKSVYLTNILNWRPPGGRTPTHAEFELSLPFIERHIQLIGPKMLILCGGGAGQILLGRTDGISRLRNKSHDYNVLTKELAGGAASIPAIVTYHPSVLFTTPMQKRAVWGDFLAMAQKVSLFT